MLNREQFDVVKERVAEVLPELEKLGHETVERLTGPENKLLGRALGIALSLLISLLRGRFLPGR